MKRLIFVIAAIALSFGAFAQKDSTMKKMDHNTMKHDKMDMSKKDGCMMMDGKMMKIKDGKMTAMTKQMTMSNGIKCMVDGSCVKKDGTKIPMKEGDTWICLEKCISRMWKRKTISSKNRGTSHRILREVLCDMRIKAGYLFNTRAAT